VARDDPVTIAGAAFVLTEFGDDIGPMIALIDRVLELNPSYAHGWFVSGAIRLNAGHFERAIEHIETSLRLSPRERHSGHFIFIGYAHLFARRFEDAAAKLLVAIQENPGLPWPYRALASCYAHMERRADAREVVKRIRSITPVVVPTHLPWRNPEHRELLLSGLRLAMGEPI
jgi:adenylate cyclase